MEEMIAHVYNTLAGDSQLQTLLGADYAERIHYEWAPDDASFPYIVHFENVTEDYHTGIYQGSWYIDVWDNGSDPAIMRSMRDRVVALFGRQFNPTVSNFKGVRFRLNAEIPLSERDNRIWRKQITFGFRAFSVKDITGVIAES